MGTTARAAALTLAAIGVWALAGPAPARVVQTAWTGYLRAGPGEQFAVLDEVGAASAVDVQGCDAHWCLVVAGAASGYLPIDLVRPGPLTPPAVEPGRQPAPCVTENLEGHRGHEAWRICGR